MRDALLKIWSYIRGASLVILGGLLGWFANQYMDYRTAYKESLSANYEQFNQAAGDVEDSLRLFAEIAKGTKNKAPADVVQLQTRLLKAVSVAEDLERRLGKDAVSSSYQRAAVELKKASDKVTGPLDAKPLVNAVNDYLVAEKKLRDTAVEEHTSFLF